MQEHPAKNFVQKVCGQFQPCTSAQTNPTTDETLTLTLTLTLWGARGRQGQARGSAVCFGGVFPPKKRAAQKASLGQQNQHPAQSFMQDVPAHRGSPTVGVYLVFMSFFSHLTLNT